MQARDLTDHGNIVDLVGSDLIGGYIHFLQKIHGSKVEGRREALQSQPVCFFFQLRLPVPGRIGFLIELIERSSVPDGAFVDLEAFVVAVQGDGIGRIGLQLHRVRTGFFGRMDDLYCPVVILIVVG